MNSKIIVDKYEAKIEGQQFLWEDCDYILRNTKFKSVDLEFDQQALIHWWMNVYIPNGYGDEEVPQEVYHSWSNALWGAFKYVKANGSYNQETNQQVVRISGYKNEPLEDHVKELQMWLPYIKSTDKGKHIDIFESTLSEFGCYDLFVTDKYEISKSVYHSRRPFKEFSNIEDAVDYIRTNLYYQKQRGKYESSSDPEDDD